LNDEGFESGEVNCTCGDCEELQQKWRLRGIAAEVETVRNCSGTGDCEELQQKWRL